MLIAVTQYGRRSLGDQRRFSPNGPRPLNDSDRRHDCMPKIIRNDPALAVRTSAKFDPLISEDRASRLLSLLDQRAGTQRSKPRSRDPSTNPLGGRVFDWSCGWPMYRIPYRDTFRYTCGLYQQCHASRSRHNHVHGIAAFKLALGAIQQRILTPSLLQQLEERLRIRVAELTVQPQTNKQLDRLQSELREVQTHRKKAVRNFAVADTSKLAEEVQTIIKELSNHEAQLNREISQFSESRPSTSANEVLESALELVRQIPELADDDQNLADIGQAFRILNLQMFVRFQPIQKRKRVENESQRRRHHLIVSHRHQLQNTPGRLP